MWEDSLIAELHQPQKTIAVAYGNDIHAICDVVRRGELSKSLSERPARLGYQDTPANLLASTVLAKSDS